MFAWFLKKAEWDRPEGLNLRTAPVGRWHPPGFAAGLIQRASTSVVAISIWDYRPSVYFYWDNLPSRRLNPATLDRATALEKAKAVARAARDRSGTDGG